MYAEDVPQVSVKTDLPPRVKRVGPPPWIDMGPLTRTAAYGAKWRREDAFPGRQVWADEIERLLSFLVSQDQFGRFLPRLRGNGRTRGAALAEARVAFFLYRNGFRITSWEPPSPNGRRGEFEVSWQDGKLIFVEVKAPDWQGELSPEEKTGARKVQGKSVDLEGRYVDPLSQPLTVITNNALPKLTPDRPNLIVIADDLFLSPVSVPFLAHRMDEFLKRPENACIGGVLFFVAEWCGGEIEYLIRFHENKAAYKTCRIPSNVRSGFNASTEADYNRKVRSYWA